MKSVLLLVVAVFSACSAVPIAENCPLYVFPVIGFHLPSYLGPWYEIQRYEQDFQAGGDCVNAYYDTYPNGSVSIYNSMIVLGAPPTLHDVYGLGVVAWPEADPVQGILNVTFTGGPPDTANYRIIGTDYINYAVVYNCVDIITNVSEQSVWILSRNSTLSPSVQGTVDHIIDNVLRLNRSILRDTYQGDEFCVLDPGPLSKH